MPRKKAARNCEMLPWLSGNMDNKDGRFLQIGNSFFFNKKVQKLKSGELRLYLCMALEAGGKREFTFTASAAKKYGIAGSSYYLYWSGLVKKGFIERLFDEGESQFAEGRWRFLTTWKND